MKISEYIEETAMTPSEAEPIIRQRLQEARARGIVLLHHRFKYYDANTVVGVCAIGAYLLDSGPLERQYSEEAMDALGTTFDGIVAFTNGWDDPDLEPDFDTNDTWHRLGKKLRAEFEPVVHCSEVPARVSSG